MKIKLISETIGTLFLLLIVVGSGIMGENLTENKGVVLLANSIATAFGLIVLIWTFGPYSGAHFNPAVSFVMMLLGKLTKQDMLQAYGTTVAKITDEDILHGIECDPSKIKGDAHKFIRSGQTTQDKHDFDWGLFQIAVDNTPAVLSNKVIGELYVSYTVKLSKPRLFAALGLSIPQDQFLVKHKT